MNCDALQFAAVELQDDAAFVHRAVRENKRKLRFMDQKARASVPVWKSTSASGATKSFLGDDVAALVPSSGEEPASPRHRAGVAAMAWRTTR